MGKVTKLHKVRIEQKEPKWVQVMTRQSFGDDEVTVAFAQSAGKMQAIIRLGKNVMDDLNCKIGDRVSLFYDENEVYHWRIAPTSNGNKIHTEGTQDKKIPYTHGRVTFSWKKQGIKFRSKKIVDHIMHGDSITFRVPYNETE